MFVKSVFVKPISLETKMKLAAKPWPRSLRFGRQSSIRPDRPDTPADSTGLARAVEQDLPRSISSPDCVYSISPASAENFVTENEMPPLPEDASGD